MLHLVCSRLASFCQSFELLWSGLARLIQVTPRPPGGTMPGHIPPRHIVSRSLRHVLTLIRAIAIIHGRLPLSQATAHLMVLLNAMLPLRHVHHIFAPSGGTSTRRSSYPCNDSTTSGDSAPFKASPDDLFLVPPTSPLLTTVPACHSIPMPVSISAPTTADLPPHTRVCRRP